MEIEWDVPIEMSDGLILRADVFKPAGDGPFPVIMTAGPYAKGLAFQEGFAGMWNNLVAHHPEVERDSTGRYQNWETVDPDKWVPEGYACVRVDSRGAGRSPGYLDLLSRQEIDDYAEAIEWAGTQSWSNGKVGLLGISYYAVNQWLVAARRPPHLAAICPWEGSSDFYREFTRHGGILDIFAEAWFPNQISNVQHGVGDNGYRNPVTGETVGGPETVDPETLRQSRADTVAEIKSRPLLDAWYSERTPVLEDIQVPVLSAANWAHWLHTRGNFEGYLRVASEQKWLEVHGLEHYTEFYTDSGRELQLRFFGHFLKGEATGWDEQPPVQLNLRTVDGGFIERAEQEWPLDRTAWTKFHLDPDRRELSPAETTGGTVTIDGTGDGATFWMPPLSEELEITGPAAAYLRVSSSTDDADIFVTLRLQDERGSDVTFISGLDPHGAVGAGWLRASHRAVDDELSTPYRPWHTHLSRQALTPGEPVDIVVEIWPTSLIIPAGYRLGVTITARDFEFDGDGPWPVIYGVEMKGHGMFVHTDTGDRPAELQQASITLHLGDDSGYLLLPVIPALDEP